MFSLNSPGEEKGVTEMKDLNSYGIDSQYEGCHKGNRNLRKGLKYLSKFDCKVSSDIDSRNHLILQKYYLCNLYYGILGLA